MKGDALPSLAGPIIDDGSNYANAPYHGGIGNRDATRRGCEPVRCRGAQSGHERFDGLDGAGCKNLIRQLGYARYSATNG